MAKELTKGIFVTFEGPEGSGKSTHSKRLCEDLKSGGYRVLHTQEPGGTPLGGRIRNILLEKDDVYVGQEAELLLFEADRAQHVRDVILPHLKEKGIVVCDRFNTATFAYQGYGLGMDMNQIEAIDKIATGGLSPDLTILLDLDVTTGLKRATANRGADKMEKRGDQFHEKVREGYLDLAKKNPDKIRVIKVNEHVEETYKLVRKEVYGLIEKYTSTE
jgi:dTMP kinase